MKKTQKTILIAILVIVIIIAAVKYFTTQTQQAVTYDELVRNLNEGKIQVLSIDDNNTVNGMFKTGQLFKTHVPRGYMDKVAEIANSIIVEDKTFKVFGKSTSAWSGFLNILIYVVIIISLLMVWMFFMQGAQGGASKAMSFGKSKAKLVKPDASAKITFKDVAGLSEEKEEMEEIVEFLKGPKKFVELGARIPTGILMVGPPGTGKTYLSRAVAGEANVPFYNMSGSDFVEMFVGVGASRVRDLFETAKKTAPSIIFIDEIDAVGRRRGAGLGGGHDEREQTLNQLLIEMDGFSVNEGIIVIAATNRPDILDPALLRAGRFDREVIIGIPDVREREEILKVHSKNKKVAEDVDFSVIAKGTIGFTPADLENLMNEAALMTGRKKEKIIRMETIEEAKIKVLVGVEKKSKVITEKEKRLTAYHEGGHALLAYLLPDTDPVHQVTIIPRGRAGGFTLQLPDDDGDYRTKKTLFNDIIISLGGRIAEKLILDDISTGASSDLRRVTKIAKAMVEKYAFSENLASMAFDMEDEVFIGRDMTSRQHHSEHIAAEIDREIRKIVDDAYNKAETMLKDNIDILHTIAKGLMKYETIDGDDFKVLVEEGFDALVERRTKKEEELKENIRKQNARAVIEDEIKKQEKLRVNSENSDNKSKESSQKEEIKNILDN